MNKVQGSSKVQRFIFSSFEEKKIVAAPPLSEEIPAPPEETPPETVFAAASGISEQELQSARETARQEGYEEGQRRGTEAAQATLAQEMLNQEARMNDILSLIANRIIIAAELHLAHMAEQNKVTCALIMAIAKKVAGEALKDNPYHLIESLLVECKALIAGEPSISIRVPPLLYPGLQQKKEDILLSLKDFNGTLEILQDETVEEYDCKVEWKNGHAERNTAHLWEEIEQIIERTPLKGN